MDYHGKWGESDLGKYLGLSLLCDTYWEGQGRWGLEWGQFTEEDRNQKVDGRREGNGGINIVNILWTRMVTP